MKFIRNNGLTSLAEPELVVLLHTGDHAAYSEIYNRYFRLMFLFAYKKLRDDEQAKDFVQELFTNFWINRKNILPSQSLSAFFYTSLQNRIVNHFIREKVSHKYCAFLQHHLAGKSTISSDQLIREKQLQIYIEKQVALLPAKMRLVFEMSRNEHMEYREIASELNISEENVRKQISNALKILRTKLSGMFFLMPF